MQKSDTITTDTMFRSIITCILYVTALLSAGAAPDNNVVITDLVAHYSIEADDGIAKRVIVEEKRSYTATRVDATSAWAIFYDENIAIDRAKAPGGNPIYRAWEDGDLFHTGSRVCVLPLKIRVGKTLNATVKRTFKDPMQFDNIIIAPSDPVRQGRWIIDIPAILADRIKVTPLRMPANATLDSVRTDKGGITYTLTLSDIPAFKSEHLAPPALSVVPVLNFAGMLGDWHDVYRYLHSLVSEDIDNAPEASTLAQKLTADIPDSDIYAKINTIAAWVRNNIRYVAIENGKYAFSPDAPDAVLAKRYGDCKGSACLIRAMLRAIGIDGRMVWIGTRDDVIGDWDKYPSIGCGNHMIAAAVLPDTTLFLDGTIRYAPDGLIPSSIAGAQALIENGSEGMLRRVPFDTSTHGTILLRGTAMPDSALRTVSGEVTLSAEGEQILYFSSIAEAVQASRRNIYLEEILSGGNRSCHLSGTTAATADNGAITAIHARYTDDGAITTTSAGKKIYINISPLRNIPLPVFDLRDRRFGAKIPAIATSRADIDITIPDGYVLDHANASAEISTPWYHIAITYTQSDSNTIHCSASMTWNTPYIDRADMETWNDDARQARRILNTPLILLATDK